jgi:uncharacterized protein YegP (UPF0339 family)
MIYNITLQIGSRKGIYFLINQPVIYLYVAGLAVIVGAGIFGSLVDTGTKKELEATQRREAALNEGLTEARQERELIEEEVDDLRQERAQLREQLEKSREETKSGETAQSALRAKPDELRNRLESLRQSQAQFELYEDNGGKWRWRLRHRNTNIVADSSQGYTRKHNVKKGTASVRRNALGASLLEIDPEPDEVLEEAPLLPETAADSKARFEVYEDAGGEYRWRLVHDNGNILAAASEGYTRRGDAKRSVDSMQDDVAGADDRFEVHEDNRGERRWRLRAKNDQIVATSGEGYSSESEAERAVERVQSYAPEADALDIGFAAFEVYEDEAEQWRWWLRHHNGNVLADGGEGYASRHGVHDAIEGVKRNVPAAEVTEE